MRVKDYLNSYRTVCLNVNRLRDRLAMEESRAERSTKALSYMPRGGDFLQDDLWARMVDSKDEYEQRLAVMLSMQTEIEEFIDRVPGEMNQIILRLRYIDLRRWEDIAVAIHYSWRQVHRLHGQALASAETVFSEVDHESRV